MKFAFNVASAIVLTTMLVGLCGAAEKPANKWSLRRSLFLPSTTDVQEEAPQDKELPIDSDGNMETLNKNNDLALEDVTKEIGRELAQEDTCLIILDGMFGMG